ncbi:anti-sigma factor [Inquilinus sp. CAU 1745]|uniref:anti-sigma factor n=1 Tax=Inquilinus sp. CAU 1745 TaxID=3140369 RepID=UPI00325B4201
MTTEEPQDRVSLAGEYVLGTLDRSTRRRFEADLTSDAELRALVDDWNRRLMPLAEMSPEVEPPAHLWARIDQATGGSRPAPAAAPAARESALVRLWDSLAVWRGAALAMTAAAAALLVYVLAAPVGEPQGRYVAVLNDADNRPIWLASVDLESGQVAIRPIENRAQPDHSFELWLVSAAGDRPPLSLGLLDADQTVRHALPDQLPPGAAADAVFAVSLEPEGGSPTGAPTGPVVFSGPILEQP